MNKQTMTRLGVAVAIGVLLFAGCNPFRVAINSTNYSINILLGLNGTGGIFNPLQVFTLLFANITNFLGLGFATPGGIILP